MSWLTKMLKTNVIPLRLQKLKLNSKILDDFLTYPTKGGNNSILLDLVSHTFNVQAHLYEQNLNNEGQLTYKIFSNNKKGIIRIVRLVKDLYIIVKDASVNAVNLEMEKNIKNEEIIEKRINDLINDDDDSKVLIAEEYLIIFYNQINIKPQ